MKIYINKIIIFIIIIIGLPIIFHKEIFGLYYDLLIESNNNIKKADAIFILCGGVTNRTVAAIELYKKGYAKEILYSQMKSKGIDSKVDDFKSFLLKKSNIKNFKSLHLYKDVVKSTFDEAYDAILYAKKNNLKSMILVTELTHTKRAKYAFEKVAKHLNYNIKIEVYGIKSITYFDCNRDNWWKNPYLFSYFMIAGMKFLIYIFSIKNLPFIEQM